MPYVQDLDHEVRVDMMLGIALAVPGHHIPPMLSLGGLAARRTSSSAHRVSTSYKGAQLGAGLSSVDRGATQGLAAWPSSSPPCGHTSAGGRPWP